MTDNVRVIKYTQYHIYIYTYTYLVHFFQDGKKPHFLIFSSCTSAIRNVVVPATSLRKLRTGLLGISPVLRLGERELLRTIPVFNVNGGGDINLFVLLSSPT